MCDCDKSPQEKIENKAVNEALMAALEATKEQEVREVKLIITNQTQALPSPLAPYEYKGVRHTVESVPALSDLLLRHGDKVNSIVYFNDANINAILDQSVKDRPFDTAIYAFVASPQADDWRHVFGIELSQREFIKFLKSREPGEVEGAEQMIAMAKKITGNFKIISEFTYNDSNNMGVVYQVSDSNGKVIEEGKMPNEATLQILMPLLKESENKIWVEIDMELIKPTDGKAPYFVFSCPRWKTFWRQAVEKAVEDLRDRLIGYLIVAGTGHAVNR